MSSNSADYASGHRTASSSSWSSNPTTASYASSCGSTRYSSASSAGSYSPAVAYHEDGTSGQRVETKTRLNHKKQIVSVTNYNQRNNDTGEPKTEYRDASRYYSRGA